jgi:hypothetical protein
MPFSDSKITTPYTFTIHGDNSYHIKINGGVAKKYNPIPLSYARIDVENAEPHDASKVKKVKIGEKHVRSNVAPWGRRVKTTQARCLENRLCLAYHDYEIIWKAYKTVCEAKARRVTVDAAYPEACILMTRYPKILIDYDIIMHIGARAGNLREQKCAPHLKDMLPKNIAAHCVKILDAEMLTKILKLLCEALKLLTLAAQILQDVERGKGKLAWILRKTRIKFGQIVGKIPSADDNGKIVLGQAETHAGKGKRPDGIIRVPYADKVAIAVWGHVPAYDIWPDTQENPEVLDLKQFFDLAVIVGRLSAGEIVTTSRAMIERLYYEINMQDEEVSSNSGFVELREARQHLFAPLSVITTKKTWLDIEKQMASDKDKITITPYVSTGVMYPFL